MDRSQMTLEFVTVISIAIIVFMIILAGLSYYASDVKRDKEIKSLNDIVESVQIELKTAKEVHNGYIREFDVPLKVNGRDFEIFIAGKELVGKMDDIEIVKFIPEINGSLKKGKNRIYKLNGSLYLE